MALTVNSNIPSLNAQRNLQKSTKALSKTLERLSSGLRINRAGDDAAGLAISENIRSQVRGINVAIRNANDGISLVNTAEGAIQEVTNMLQRMRELSIQAANDVNSAQNRRALQLEFDQLIEELSRVADTVQFNGRTLFDGSFEDMKLQIGAEEGQTLEISISDLRAEKLGAAAVETSTAPTAAISGSDLTLNGEAIGESEDDGVSYANGAFSAIAIANAINSMEGLTNVFARVNANTVTGDQHDAGTPIEACTLDENNALIINGTQVPSATVVADDSDSALRDAINSVTNQTGVVASLNSSDQLVLTAEDGRNITIETTDDGTPNDIAQKLGLAAAAGEIDPPETTVGTYTIYSDDTISISGNSPASAGLTAQTIGISYDTAVNNSDIRTHEGANNAIINVDFALRQINENRAGLGAITNRLEMTINNLQTVAENLAASDSRIRDADYAHETAQLTRNQILQQAGVAVLAQANVTPQAALNLLQG